MVFLACLINLVITGAFSSSLEDRFQLQDDSPSSSYYDEGDEFGDAGYPDWHARGPAALAPAPLRLPEPLRMRIPQFLSSPDDNNVPTTFQCGLQPVERPPTVDPRLLGQPIVAGMMARERWPWMVQILRREDRELICGGTLLSDRHVITAAHCVKGSGGEYAADELIIRLGDQDREAVEPLERDANIDCLFVHPNYKVTNLRNDIAILKLSTNRANRITLSENLRPACLPEKKEFRTGHRCIITGWGYRDFADYFYGYSSPTLMEATVPLMGYKKCQRLGRTYGAEVTKKMQCAGYLSGASRADTCKRDSGGPLICENEQGIWKLWGITSWGDNTFCEESPDLPSPGVYTRVDKYLSWIDNKLHETCPSK